MLLPHAPAALHSVKRGARRPYAVDDRKKISRVGQSVSMVSSNRRSSTLRLLDNQRYSFRGEDYMRKLDLLRALQTEIRRHTFDTFVDTPPSIAQGGNGVVTPGCPA